ncbi:hypothetical protein ACHAXH_007831 [Discostella pseudostelligera]
MGMNFRIRRRKHATPSGSANNTKYAADVPYKTSVSFITVFAALSPIATAVLPALLRAAANDNDDGQHHRLLQDDEECIVKSNELQRELAIWDAVKVTSIISGSVALFCLVLYELYRRDPIVRKYCYDRKRLTQPDRSPPPLMISRSLWRGCDDAENNKNNDASCRISCCRNCPAILELVFLNLSAQYIQYSRAADEARIEREKRGAYTCCRADWYHRNCCSNYGKVYGDNEGYTTDEDGYTFYPEYLNGYSHIFQAKTLTYSLGNNRKSIKLSAPALGNDDENLGARLPKTIIDLFPEDDPRQYFASVQAKSSRNLLNSLVTFDPYERQAEEDSIPSDSEAVNASTNGSDGAHKPANSTAGVTEGQLNDGTTDREMISKHSSLDVNELNNIGEAGDSEQRNRNTPSASDAISRNGSILADESNQPIDRLDDAVRHVNLGYPYRHKYILMPPGFHTWGDVSEFLADFFFIPSISRWFRKLQSQLSLMSPNNRSPPLDPLPGPGKELEEGEKELLRCAGLDTYLLVRSARFGFDVTFYPFLISCVAILPVYKYHDAADAGASNAYFNLTIESVPNGSKTMIWIVVFTILLYIYILRRLWIEWEVFITLRHDFLANGDTSFYKRPTYLRKYRNSCLVECIPKSHRSDTNLKDVFESLFPGQIEHAEMLINTSKLEDIVNKRQTLVDKHDRIDARYRFEQWQHVTYHREGLQVCWCSSKVHELKVPKVRIGGRCSGKTCNAIEYYDTEITKLDQLASEEYDRIVETRLKWRYSSVLANESEDIRHSCQFGAHRLYSLFVPSDAHKFFGEVPNNFFHGTGIVTFKSIASKQSAVQCNLSGQPYWMITDDAPDPRDVFWKNVGADRLTIESRKILVQCVLLLGILAWGTIATYINRFTLMTIGSIPLGLSQSVVQGYLPALVVSLILLWLPNLFFMLAMRVIRFKSHTQVDNFVLLWNTSYRLANIFFAFFSISLLQAIKCFKDDPDGFIKLLAKGIIGQSAYLMNLIILATGQETMLQLLQWRSLIKQAVVRPLINLNARSKRYRDWLNEAPQFEQSFIFGFFAPVLSYGLMIAVVFGFMTPMMLGVCAIFFWVATKVHTNNALFVYCQRCEGGGKIFYYWNQIVFVTIYSSIVVFSSFLVLKQFPKLGLAFLVVMIIITYCVDKSVETTFAVHSLHLPMSMARIHDEEEVCLLEDSCMQSDGGENFMYRHPILKHENWSFKPTWT